MRKSRALTLLVALSLSGTGTGTGTALASFLDDDIRTSAISDPLPDTTIRTNTQACINRYQDLYTLAGQYFNNLPAATSVKRIDMLVGGVPSSSGFTALELGRQHQTEYYSMRSTYGTADTKFAGIQSILRDSRDPTTTSVQSLLTLTRSDGMRIVIGARHSSCDATQKASDLVFSIQKGPVLWNEASVPNPKCQLEVNFTPDLLDKKGFCGEELKTSKLSDLVTSYRNKIASVSMKVSSYGSPPVDITPAEVDTPVKLEAKLEELGGAQLSYPNEINRYTYGADCYVGWAPSDWNPEWTDAQRIRANNRRVLSQLLLAAASKQATLDFLDSISAGALKNLSLETACSKAK